MNLLCSWLHLLSCYAVKRITGLQRLYHVSGGHDPDTFDGFHRVCADVGRDHDIVQS